MNPSTILALISDLYGQVVQLTEENRQLRQALTERDNAQQEPDAKANGQDQEPARTST